MKTLTLNTIWFSILTITFISTISIEIKGQRSPSMISLGDIFKKPKDFNKPPDPNENQKPVNGEFKANPQFFVAKDDKERCQAIDLWLSSIRYEASQSYANRGYNRQNEEIDMNRVNGGDIIKLATPSFRNIFGKALPEVTEKEVKQIGKSLDKCTTQRWVAYNLEPLFSTPYPNQMGEWFRNFANYEAAFQQEKVRLEQENYRQKYQSAVANSGYPVAELLKETDSYRLHSSFLNNGNTQWCSSDNNQAVVGMIFKTNENFRIENNDQYWRLFESEILPTVKSACPVADKVYVLNYVNGFYINFDRNEIKTSPLSASSNMLNVGVYSISANSRAWMGGTSNFGGSNYTGAGRRTQRTSTVEINDSNTVPSFASIASLRMELQGRQARIDDELRISREKAAAAEAARQAEIARKTEARRNLLATGGFSSKGLKNEELFANIFLGDFEALPFKRDDISFSTLISAYLNSYAESCPTALPANKVEMTVQECATEKETRNGWGTVISRTCVEWRTRPTGLYADPALYAAKKSVDRAQATKILNPSSGGGALGGILEALSDFASGKTLNEMSKALDVSGDVAPLISMNACSGQGLKRFQENLRRFAVNESPLLGPLPAAQTAASPPKTESEKPQTVVQKAKPTPKKTITKKRPNQ